MTKFACLYAFFRKKRYFFDSGAFVPVSKKVIKSINFLLKKQNQLKITNPFSSYKEGRCAQEIIMSSRKFFSESVGVKPESVFFISSVSEAVELFIREAIKQSIDEGNTKPHLVIGVLEHSSILKLAENLKKDNINISFAMTDEFGRICANDLSNKIKKETVLVCVQSVNADTGIRNNVHKLSLSARKINKEILFISDITQDISYTKTGPNSLAVDAVFFDTSKFGAPKGIAVACFASSALGNKFTKNNIKNISSCFSISVPFIYGATVAYSDMIKTRENRIKKLRKHQLFLINRVVDILPGWGVYGINTDLNNINSVYDDKLLRLSPHILNLHKGQSNNDYHIAFLDEHGFSVSKGSACRVFGSDVTKQITENSKHYTKPSESGIRVSFLPNTKKRDINKLLSVIKKADKIQGTKNRQS